MNYKRNLLMILLGAVFIIPNINGMERRKGGSIPNRQEQRPDYSEKSTPPYSSDTINLGQSIPDDRDYEEQGQSQSDDWQTRDNDTSHSTFSTRSHSRKHRMLLDDDEIETTSRFKLGSIFQGGKCLVTNSKNLLLNNPGIIEFCMKLYCIEAARSKNSKLLKAAAVLDGALNITKIVENFVDLLETEWNRSRKEGILPDTFRLVRSIINNVGYPKAHRTVLDLIMGAFYGSNLKKDWNIWTNSKQLAIKNAEGESGKKTSARRLQQVWLSANYLIPLLIDMFRRNDDKLCYKGYKLLSNVSEAFRTRHLHKHLYNLKKAKNQI